MQSQPMAIYRVRLDKGLANKARRHLCRNEDDNTMTHLLLRTDAVWSRVCRYAIRSSLNNLTRSGISYLCDSMGANPTADKHTFSQM